ncbi:MAG: deoxyribonuclease IV [Nitrospinae bacterium]|nr:deoxyribonuclease IV [Nitrospinota bacterium]
MPLKKESRIRPPALTRPWGAHMSIAGGVERAVERGAKAGARAIQIFTKNNTQWKGKPIGEAEAAAFADNMARLKVAAVAAHDCYLINLAAPDPVISQKSRAAFLDEIERADLLNIPNLVFHPGSALNQSEPEGIARVAESLNWLITQRPASRVTLALETTAGQGSSLGWRFGQIAAIIERVERRERLGVCFDTCHVFAAGYPIDEPEGYERTMREFDAVIGLARLKLFHMNDSLRERGSRVDRHEHIGQGRIGLKGFRLLVNDPRFVNTPMILETPKDETGRDDIINLRRLMRLAARQVMDE